MPVNYSLVKNVTAPITTNTKARVINISFSVTVGFKIPQ